MNVCLHEKLRENKKDDLSTKKEKNKNCKDNLRTLFVETPSYYGAVVRAASSESALPKMTLIPANQLLKPHQTLHPFSPCFTRKPPPSVGNYTP